MTKHLNTRLASTGEWMERHTKEIAQRPTVRRAGRIAVLLCLLQTDRDFAVREIPASVAMVSLSGPSDVDGLSFLLFLWDAPLKSSRGQGNRENKRKREYPDDKQSSHWSASSQARIDLITSRLYNSA
jgi:hypothetical protein